MKKALSVVLALLLICSVMPMSVFAADDTVKTVSSAEELAAVANDLAGNYKLMSNIDLSKYNGGKWTPIASSGTFSGTFEGNGKKITGLNVSLTGTGTLYGGLFGNVSGTIKNLTVSGTVSVTVSGSSSASAYAGGIAGCLSGWFSSIEGCTSSVSATASLTVSSNSFLSPTGYAYAGGIVGSSSAWSDIVECAHTGGAVSASANMTNKGNCEAYAGGIAGKMTASVKDCYNTAEVSSSAVKSAGDKAAAYSGGLAGYGKNFTTSYNTGKVTASGSSSYGGAIAGYCTGTSTNCYYKSGVCSASFGGHSGDTAPAATSKSSLANKNCSGFDFDNVWDSQLLSAPVLYSKNEIIGGKLAITGTYEYGAQLKADMTNITPASAWNKSGALGISYVSYQWYRGEKNSDGNIEYIAISKATGDSYTLAADDVGKYIMLTVRGRLTYSGSVKAESGRTVSKKTPAKPTAELSSKTDTSVTLVKISGAQYCIATKSGTFSSWKKGDYQDSNVFSGLKPNTTYRFYVKIPATETSYASAESAYLEVTTFEEGYDPYSVMGKVEISGTPSAGQKLTAVTSGLSASQSGTISYTYQWNRNGAAISGATSASYTLTNADIGTDITVTVTAKSPFKGTFVSGAVTVPISKPTGIKAANAADGIVLTWNSVAGAESYKIYRKNFVWTSAGTSTSASYTVTGLTSGTEYTFSVEAVKGSKTSGYDNTGITYKYLGVPSGLSVHECQAKTADLNWNSVQGATAYKVYRGTTLVATTTDTSYSVSNLTKGTTYSFSVAAADGDYVSAKSAAVSVKITGTGSHSFGEWQTVKAAGCETEGSKQRVCSACGKVETSVITAVGHDIASWNQTKKPTCTDKGEQKGYCRTCRKTITEEIAALGHDYEKTYTVDVEAKCTEAGSKSIHCTRCEATKNVTVIPAAGHKYGEWITTKNATCTEDGAKKHICSVCTAEESGVITKLGHDFASVWTEDTPATCTEAGSKSHHCTRCEAKKDVTAIKALGHDYKWSIIKEASYTEEGKKHGECSRCPSTVDEVIPMLVLQKPTGMKAVSYFDDTLRVTWNACEGAESYNVYRNENGKWVLKANVKELSYLDSDVVNAVTYTYTVEAVSGKTVSGYDETGVSAQCIISPAGISVANVYNGVLIKWSYVPNVEKYRLYRRIVTVDPATGEEIYGGWQVALTTSDGKLTECRDTNKDKMKSGTIYQYCVRSMVGSQQGPINVSQTTILYLTAPDYKLVRANGGVKLSWKAIVGADYYRVYRRPAGTTKWKSVIKTTALSALDKTAESGTKYQYAVRAFINESTSTYRCSSFVSRTLHYVAAPVFTAANVSGGIKISWSKVGGADKYIVYRKAVGASGWSKIATVKTLSYTDKTAKKGTTYYYTVKAVDGTVNSAYDTTGVKIKKK